MGTITPRKRSDGTTGYTAQIRLSREGKRYTEAQTFDRRPAAAAWIARREEELRQPGAVQRAQVNAPTLRMAIDRYIAETRRAIGRTKAQVLGALKSYDIADMRCDDIASTDLVALAGELGRTRQPQTVANYISHLSAIFAIAQPAWNYPLDRQAMRDAQAVLARLGATSKSKKRDRRPTLAELDRLMAHFTERSKRVPRSAPMPHIIAFAIFSTRRLEEITLLRREDLDRDGKRILVRNMKHPGEKAGNDVWCDLPDPAPAVIDSAPGDGPRLFPYSADAISAAFTRACHVLGIENLHFHDLRHDGVSRLFEMGLTVPRAAAVSGHRSWSSLQRYTHIRQTGDKYADWSWLRIIAPPRPREGK